MPVFKHILVPTDFSEPARAALLYAQALSEQLGSHLHVLHVVPEPYVYPWGTEMTTLPLGDILAQSEEAVRQRLSELARGLDLPRHRVTTDTAIGTPVDGILFYADENHVDLIVMGTHGRGMVGHMLLGSVTERVVRRSTVPVLTVHGVQETSSLKTGSMAAAERHS